MMRAWVLRCGKGLRTLRRAAPVYRPLRAALCVMITRYMAKPRNELLLMLWFPLSVATVGSILVACRWNDFGLNLVAEAIGAWFALLVVDGVTKKYEVRRARPINLALMREA